MGLNNTHKTREKNNIRRGVKRGGARDMKRGKKGRVSKIHEQRGEKEKEDRHRP